MPTIYAWRSNPVKIARVYFRLLDRLNKADPFSTRHAALKRMLRDLQHVADLCWDDYFSWNTFAQAFTLAGQAYYDFKDFNRMPTVDLKQVRSVLENHLMAFIAWNEDVTARTALDALSWLEAIPHGN